MVKRLDTICKLVQDILVVLGISLSLSLSLSAVRALATLSAQRLDVDLDGQAGCPGGVTRGALAQLGFLCAELE